MVGGPTGIEHLVTLVGSNPMSSYLAVRALRPKRVTLVPTAETEKPAGNLRKALLDIVDQVDHDIVVGSSDERNVRSKLKTVFSGGATLDYTGGTKVMSAGARLAFEDAGRVAGDACYIDDRGLRLRWASGESDKLGELITEALDPYTILALHGVDIVDRGSEAQSPTTSERAIAKAALDGQRQPDGTWLERLTGGYVKQVCEKLKQPHVVLLNVKWQRRGSPGEADVIATIGCRTVLIECGTSRQHVRDKLYTVAARARHLGGDLTRPALVCLQPEQRPPGAEWLTAPRLRQIGDPKNWESPNAVQVFAREQVKAWLSQDLSALRRWLEPPE